MPGEAPLPLSQSPEALSAGDGEAPALSGDELARLREARARWQHEQVDATVAKMPLRAPRFTTISDVELPDLVTPVEKAPRYLEELGWPGEFPFTRGVQPTMYRGRLWTMRQFAGFGSPEDTNARFRYLLEQGQTGLSTAFDFPTLMGYDSDSPRALGEVGVCGVAVDTLADMEVLFDRIPLDRVTTSMTINGPAVVLYAFYVALADLKGIPRGKIGGTIQNDCLKEFIAQHAWLVPPRPAMRVVTDMMEFASAETPRWNIISISGYHIREAGATAAQELAFTLADGLAYVQSGIDRGMPVDRFAPRLSFFFDVHSDFFEEIAKFRAARRLWARLMRERYGASDASCKLRTHAQTAGVSLTAQQPYNNVVRVALQALAAVLGGTQSLHTNSLDETYALPTAEAATLALRTQQIIAHESGVAGTIDPLGGAYFIEWLTDRLEAEALSTIRKIDEMGGMVAAIEKGFPQREIAVSAYRFQRQLERHEKTVVGVNDLVMEEQGRKIPILKIDEATQQRKIEELRALKARRDGAAVTRALADVRRAAEGTGNLVPPIVAAARAYATQQEVCDVLRDVLGTYSDPADF